MPIFISRSLLTNNRAYIAAHFTYVDFDDFNNLFYKVDTVRSVEIALKLRELIDPIRFDFKHVEKVTFIVVVDVH